METWKRHPEYNSYEVSDLGRVRKGGRILAQRKSNLYYSRVTLFFGGRKFDKRVHRLVGETFLNCPQDLCVLHKDETLPPNEINNLTNLWIGDRIDNHKDRDKKQRIKGSQKYMRLSDSDCENIRNLYDSGLSGRQIHREYYPDEPFTTIYQIATKKRRFWGV